MLGTYTARFNRRHRLFGHLFSGRYKALLVDGSGTGYLKTVCDYVHLNPARAKLLLPEQGGAVWPEYLKRPTERWPWLRVDRLLGEYRIPQDSAAGRQQLAAELEQRRKGDPGKVDIAWRLRTETTMTLKWIATELQMGAWTHVSNLLSQRRQPKAPEKLRVSVNS